MQLNSDGKTRDSGRKTKVTTVFYDHDLPTKRNPSRGALRNKAAQLEWGEASLISQAAKAGDSLIDDIIRRSWEVGFFHINDDSIWTKLVKAAGKRGALVRVSTQGFVPDILESAEPLALRLLPKIDAVTAEQFDKISVALHDPRIRGEIGKGYIPATLREFFAFVRPNFSTALWLYGVAWLAHRLVRERRGSNATQLRDDLKSADVLLSKVGWTGTWRGLEQAACPTASEVFSIDVLNGRSIEEHLNVELGFTASPEWVRVISEAVTAGREPEIKDMTAAIEGLTHELRVATRF